MIDFLIGFKLLNILFFLLLFFNKVVKTVSSGQFYFEHLLLSGAIKLIIS